MSLNRVVPFDRDAVLICKCDVSTCRPHSAPCSVIRRVSTAASSNSAVHTIRVRVDAAAGNGGSGHKDIPVRVYARSADRNAQRASESRRTFTPVAMRSQNSGGDLAADDESAPTTAHRRAAPTTHVRWAHDEAGAAGGASRTSWYASLVISALCLITLSLPTVEPLSSTASPSGSGWPSWMPLPTAVQKLSAAYVLGIVTMILVR